MQQLARGLAALWLAAFSAAVLAQARELPDFTRLVEEQGNAVVNISTTQAVRRPTAQAPGAIPQVPGMEDEEVLEFFRRFIPRQPGPGQGPGPGGPGRESRSIVLKETLPAVLASPRLNCWMPQHTALPPMTS